MAPFQRICQELAKLPVELAHQILSDLKVWDVLKLLWYDNPRVNAVIASHHGCKRILGEDEETFSTTTQNVKIYFGMYVKVGLRFKPPPHGRLSLGVDALLAYKYKVEGSDRETRTIILREVEEPLRDFLRNQITISGMDFEPYIDRSIFPHGIPKVYACTTPQQLDQCMDVLLHAKKTLSRRTSEQLYWAASLLEQNPDILKRTLDPEQQRRPNTAHIVDRIRFMANQAGSCDPKRFFASEFFGFYFFPVIPFDSALVELLGWMEKYGLMSTATTDNNVQFKHSHAHPLSIEKHANTVIEGMPYFYTDSPLAPAAEPEKTIPRSAVLNGKGQVLRTVHTPFSESNQTGSKLQKPFFTVHRIASHKEFRLPVSIQAREPNDLREQAWLASFVGLYRYLEVLDKTSTLAIDN
ncbi:uncharacterized protein BDV14DRAFT_166567 [Aspergillus stella-maris]|uniref:uncharacterized protein n=1 Tax=Aspergillus stella-maris TaxID=1810926 RepID=UPI003CCD60DE